MSSTPPEDGEDSEEGGAKDLPATVEAILEQIPAEGRANALLMIRNIFEQHSGPVPSSREMAGYKAIDPSFPERFFKQLEQQSAHRQALERKVVEDDYKVKTRGQHYALISVGLCLAFALALALIGATTAAAIVGGTTVVGIVTVFITGRAIPQRASTSD
jgi:uncharacterized membrane protein